MAKNPLIRTNQKMTGNTTGGHKSAGILDDFAIRKVINTKEGTIEKVPVDDSDIANKLYVDGLTGGATGSFIAASGETVTVVNGLVTSISAVFLILLETGDSILMENSDRIENG